MLTLNDGRIELWQWDTGRKLSVDADCSQVHFSNKVFGRSIDVDVLDGVASIPDILLQTDKELAAWAFVGTAENGYTKISKVFKVNKRNKPADYVFTPPEQTSLEKIKEKLDYLESIQDPDAIKNAVEDYLDRNPVEAPVQSVNGKTGKIKLTAEDVGAISQDKLQEATNEALAQAKESGEFKGDPGEPGQPGKDYILTPADKTEIAEMAAELVDVPDSGGNVAYDEAQNLTDEQKAQARDNIGAQPVGNYLTKVPDGYAKTEDIPTDEEIIQLIKDNAPESSGGGIAVTGATVGQTVKISAVDENGVPTAWESVDFPSGGDEEVREWEEFMRFTTDNAETMSFDFSSNGTETLESKKVKEFYIYSPVMENTGCGIASVLVNDRVNITGLTDFGRGNNGSMKLGLFTSSNSLDIWYFGRDTVSGLDANTNGIACNSIPAVEKNGLLEVSLNAKNTWRKIYYYHNGIPLPGLPIDYIKSVVVTTASACSSGVEFIVFVR